MHEWGLAGVALLLIGYAAVSGRLQSTVVTQAMVFVALGLLVGNRVLHLVEADAANQYVRHLAMPESAPVTEPRLRVPAQPSGR